MSPMKGQMKSNEEQSKVVEERDLDTPLTTKDREALDSAFFSRYCMRYPPHVMPSDGLITRMAREIQAKRLSVWPLRKVTTLDHCKEPQQKKLKIADSVFLEASIPAPEGKDPTSVTEFLHKLHTLMLAYSRVGTCPVLAEGVERDEEMKKEKM